MYRYQLNKILANKTLHLQKVRSDYIDELRLADLADVPKDLITFKLHDHPKQHFRFYLHEFIPYAPLLATTVNHGAIDIYFIKQQYLIDLNSFIYGMLATTKRVDTIPNKIPDFMQKVNDQISERFGFSYECINKHVIYLEYLTGKGDEEFLEDLDKTLHFCVDFANDLCEQHLKLEAN